MRIQQVNQMEEREHDNNNDNINDNNNNNSDDGINIIQFKQMKTMLLITFIVIVVRCILLLTSTMSISLLSPSSSRYNFISNFRISSDITTTTTTDDNDVVEWSWCKEQVELISKHYLHVTYLVHSDIDDDDDDSNSKLYNYFGNGVSGNVKRMNAKKLPISIVFRKRRLPCEGDDSQCKRLTVIMSLKTSPNYLFDSNELSDIAVLSKDVDFNQVATAIWDNEKTKRGVIFVNTSIDVDVLGTKVSSSIKYVINELLAAYNHSTRCSLAQSFDDAKSSILDFYHNNYNILDLSDTSNEQQSNGGYLGQPEAVTWFKEAVTWLRKANDTNDVDARQEAVLHALRLSRQLTKYSAEVARHFPIEQFLALVLPFWVPIIVPLVKVLF